MRLAALAGIEIDAGLHACHGALDPAAPADYRELAALLACSWRSKPPAFVGLSGGQGAGKTTLGRLLEAACSAVGLRTCVVALDDFYLPKADRRARAERVHPLFETRGPPGTHDTVLCADRLRALRRPGDVDLPVFDKSLDDRDGLRRLTGPFDVVVLEGWCVAARACAESELAIPSNAFEAECDEDGRWRRIANAALSDQYGPIWGFLEELVFLRVPSLGAVRRWRLEQEQARPLDLRMGRAAVDRFVAHFERWTRSMLEDLPDRADWVVDLDEAHRVADLSWRGRRRE